ncbi:hypothetical protein PV08_05851 [Exophiala spinifera]|uniref:Zn(2)-C6 fungal-type domain-containing protein n=1 Tax=Exophiala spinifera TaxID=91928 RepID=A0A0D1YL81_9EURO|nr:uncharacterized protein PV08_05851 [Exophiala spinifera]KIW15801.1 hypothetical protein PV08_05851 [Exophiala spinifera]
MTSSEASSPAPEEFLDSRKPEAERGTKRKRQDLASVACNSCRSRKGKCDEVRPVCGTCIRLNQRCVYEERRKPKLEVILGDILNSLQLLQLSTDQILSSRSRPVRNRPRPAASPQPESSTVHHSQLHQLPTASWAHLPVEQSQDSPDVTDFRDFRHATAAHKLYSWPQIQRSVTGVDIMYPIVAEFAHTTLSTSIIPPFRLAQVQHPGQADFTDCITGRDVRTLLGHYFRDYYPVYPIVAKPRINEISQTIILDRGFGLDSESCMLLLVFALGAFSAYFHGEADWGQAGADSAATPPGIGFFNKARHMLALLPKGRIETAQCHVLTGLYYAQLLRAYDFWSSIHEAAITICHIISLSGPDKVSADIVRGFWVTYILESTILAELDLPASKLYQLQDTVPLPFGYDDGHSPTTDSDSECHFVLLANIALRKLLNRAYQTIYSTDSLGAVAPDMSNPHTSLNYELSLQLDRWRHHLPPSISSKMDTDWVDYVGESPNNLMGLLRARYWVSKFVVYRPYILKAISAEPGDLTSDDLHKVEECLDAGLRVPQEVGLLTTRARLVVSPFAPIRR